MSTSKDALNKFLKILWRVGVKALHYNVPRQIAYSPGADKKVGGIENVVPFCSITLFVAPSGTTLI